jgi:hypothetical protein
MNKNFGGGGFGGGNNQNNQNINFNRGGGGRFRGNRGGRRGGPNTRGQNFDHSAGNQSNQETPTYELCKFFVGSGNCTRGNCR